MIKQWASEGHLDDTSNCTVHSYKHFKVRSLFLIPRERILSATRHCPETKPHSVVSRFQASVGKPKEACQWSAFPSLASRVSSFWDVCWTLVIVSLGKPSGKQILLHPSYVSPGGNPHSSRQWEQAGQEVKIPVFLLWPAMGWFDMSL